MSQIIEVSDECAALLKRQAEANGVTVDAWVEVLARDKARVHDIQSGPQKKTAAARSLEIQSRLGAGNWLQSGERVPRTRLRRPPSIRLVFPL